MALVADTQQALELLQGVQSELQQKGDVELTQDLGDMMAVLSSPLLAQLLTLQTSVRRLRDHVESTPPGKPVGQFDFTPSGELLLEPPSKPEEPSGAVPVGPPSSPHPFAYENVIDITDEGVVKVTKAEQQQSGPPQAPPQRPPQQPPQPEDPPSDVDEVDALLDSIAQLAMGREVLTVKLMKPEKGGLGFSVIGLKWENQEELGIFVQQIQPQGVADRNGELKENDQILAINGRLLDATVSHQEAIVMLQQVKGLVELVVARDGQANEAISALKKKSQPPPLQQPVQPPVEEVEPKHEIETIQLFNDGSGLGFGIVGVHDVGIMVKTILPGGTADQDGRLKSGDIILQIGDIPLQGMTSDQVATVLRQAGSHVRLTVARRVMPSPATNGLPGGHHEAAIVPTLASEAQSSPPMPAGEEKEEDNLKIFEVVLEKGAEGLGITIAGYVRDLGTGQMSGIFIKKIAEGSAADRNGMMQVNDQIIEVDGQGLEGFTNVEAVDLLRHTGSVVHVKVARHPPGTLDISNMAMDQPAAPSIPVAAVPVATDPMATDPVAADQVAADPVTTDPVAEDIIQPQQVSDEESAPPVSPPFSPPLPAAVMVGQSEVKEPSPYEGELDPEVQASLITAWQSILGLDVIIVVAQLSRFREGGGLGISLEGTVDIDESGEEVRPHHYIRSILQDGPVGKNGRLTSGDELLEVNGERLLGLNHVDVVRTLKELPMHVRIVCARHPHPVFPEASPEQAPDVQPKSPHGRPESPAAADDLPVTQLDAPPPSECVPFPEVAGSGDLDPLTAATMAAAATAAAESGPPASGEASPSGLAVWDDQLLTVELIKGERGLGFSILDYQDPLNPAKTVIVIRSLVAGGEAQRDGRLVPGDRLVYVNDSHLDNCSLEVAVQALKGAPPGLVVLRVAKPLPQLTADDTPEGQEAVIRPQTVGGVSQAPPSSTQAISAHAEELQELNDMQIAMEASAEDPSAVEDQASHGILVEETVNASVSSSVESSIDFSPMMSEPEATPSVNEVMPPAALATPPPRQATPPPSTEKVPSVLEGPPLQTTPPVAKVTTPPDLLPVAAVTPIPAKREEPVSSPQVEELRSIPPEPKRQPPTPPPKPSPRSSVVTPTNSAPTTPTTASHHSPLSLRPSVVLPSFLEKSIVLKKGNAGLGLTVNADKSNGVVVKSIIRGGAVHHDGRLAVGDYITSVNNESMRNLTNVEARAMLRRASLVGDEISLTYIPASDASAYRDKPAAFSPKSDATLAAQGSEEERFALPLKDKAEDSVKLASVALSPMVVSSNATEEIRTVRLNKEPNKSLGISIVGGRATDGQPVEGIYIKHVLDDSQAGRTGALKTGDRILEVNGCDLRDASHDYAVAIIRNAANPVCFIVQSLPAGDNMPTGTVSVIPGAEEEVVATTTEKTEAAPSPLPEKREGSEVNGGVALAPLSPLKHQLSLSGSEDEVEETKDSLEADIAAKYGNLDGEIFVIQLTKSSKGLGLSLAGNRDRSKRSVFVVGVDAGGAAGQDGRLQVADEILRINNESVYGKSHQKASALIKDIPRDGEVCLVVRRHPLALEQLAVTPLTPTPNDKEMRFSLPAPESEMDFSNYPNVHTITINKGTTGLGFAVFEKQDCAGKFGIFVRDISKGSAAEEEGSLRPGDHILAVDGNVLVDTKKREAILVLKGTEGKVILMVSSEKPLVQLNSSQDLATPLGQDTPAVEAVIAASVVTEVEHAAPTLAGQDQGMTEGEDVFTRDTGGERMEDERETVVVMEIESRDEDIKTEEQEDEVDVQKDEEKLEAVQAQTTHHQEQEPLGEVGGKEEGDAPEMEAADEPPEPTPKSESTSPLTEPNPEPTPSLAPVSGPSPSQSPSPDPVTQLSSVQTSAAAVAAVAVVAVVSDEEPEADDDTNQEDPYTCPIVPGVPTDIVIDRGKIGLGLSIVGGTDTQLTIVVVHEVYEHGAAARDNRLWPGDQLIQVNGIDLTEVRHDQAIAALRQSPTHVRLRVYRDDRTRQGMAEEEEEEEQEVMEEAMMAEVEEEDRPDEEEYDEMLSVELQHIPGRNLGLNIVGKTCGRGVVISMILRGSAAHAQGSLQPGDHILSVNGQDVQEASREEVAALLKASQGHVLFEIGRKLDQTGHSVDKQPAPPAKQVRHVKLKKVPGESLGLSITGGKGSDMGDMPLIIASINPGSQAEKCNQLKVLDCIESINGQSVAGLTYAGAIGLLKSSRGVISLEVSEPSPAVRDWFLEGQHPQAKGDGVVAVKASVQQPASPSVAAADETSAGRVKHIELQRGADGLGFSIVGGHGSPHGDLPIYIKTVFGKGAAADSGELHRGDQILAVNGQSLEAATHEQAVEVLKRAKGRVVITILA